MKLEKYVSPLIPSQFPSFYHDDGKDFVEFVKAYYEWLELPENVGYLSRSTLENIDVDETLDAFLKYFKRNYASPFPSKTAIDTRLLVKHATDLYLAVGTTKAIELMFRMVYGKTVFVTTPGDNVLRASDGTWITPHYVEVSGSPYLIDMVGRQVHTGGGTAIAESLATKTVGGRVVNVMYISNVVGTLKFGEKLYCDDLYVHTLAGDVISEHDYSLLSTEAQAYYEQAITFDNAPLIFGSLSAIAITNGGAGYEIGDIVDVGGSGQLGKAKVVSTRDENGKVSFTLVDGGFGFSMDALVTVSGGYGSGATFKVGGLANKRIYRINSDDIVDHYSTQMDMTSLGVRVRISSSTGDMITGETVTGDGYTRTFDVEVVSDYIANGHTVSNSSLGISSLLVMRSEESFLQLAGSEADLDNANLVNGAVLVSNAGAIVSINTAFPTTHTTVSANVVSGNSTYVFANYVDGYFVPGTTITGGTSGETANVVWTLRESDWNFPKVVNDSNLDTPGIGDALTTFDLEVGTITNLSSINPGIGYSSNPTVDIVEPYIYELRIPDEIRGGFYGYNASVDAHAGNARGIVTGVEVYDSGFGYTPSATLIMTSNTNETAITGKAVVDQHGLGVGYWEDNRGFMSDKMRFHDSDYYQAFSYEIAAPMMPSRYEDDVKRLVHPAGFKMFGKYIMTSAVGEDASETELTVTTA